MREVYVDTAISTEVEQKFYCHHHHLFNLYEIYVTDNHEVILFVLVTIWSFFPPSQCINDGLSFWSTWVNSCLYVGFILLNSFLYNVLSIHCLSFQPLYLLSVFFDFADWQLQTLHANRGYAFFPPTRSRIFVVGLSNITWYMLQIMY